MASPLGCQTIEVETFGSKEKVALKVPMLCTCKQALVLLANELGLKETSLPLFGLFSGALGQPMKLLKDESTLPFGCRLSLQRWVAQVDGEAKLVKADDAAIRILSSEARLKVEMGEIELTDQDRSELDSFSDPLFPTDRQFLDVIRKIPGYGSLIVHDCTVPKAIVTNDVRIPDNSVVKIIMTIDGMSLRENEPDGSLLLHFKWNIVKRWRSGLNVIMFEVCLKHLNAVLLQWITFQTPQYQVLFQASGAVCAEVKRAQDRLKHEDNYDTERSLPEKFVDPLKEFINHALFKPPEFNAVM